MIKESMMMVITCTMNTQITITTLTTRMTTTIITKINT